MSTVIEDTVAGYEHVFTYSDLRRTSSRPWWRPWWRPVHQEYDILQIGTCRRCGAMVITADSRPDHEPGIAVHDAWHANLTRFSAGMM